MILLSPLRIQRKLKLKGRKMVQKYLPNKLCLASIDGAVRGGTGWPGVSRWAVKVKRNPKPLEPGEKRYYREKAKLPQHVQETMGERTRRTLPHWDRWGLSE